MDRNTIIRVFEGGGVIYFAALDIEDLFPVLNWDSDLITDEFVVEIGKNRMGNRVFNFVYEQEFGFSRLPYRVVQIPRYADALIRNAVNKNPLSFGLRDEVGRHFCRLGASRARVFREKQKDAELIRLRQEVEILRGENAELRQIIDLL